MEKSSNVWKVWRGSVSRLGGCSMGSSRVMARDGGCHNKLPGPCDEAEHFVVLVG